MREKNHDLISALISADTGRRRGGGRRRETVPSQFAVFRPSANRHVRSRRRRQDAREHSVAAASDRGRKSGRACMRHAAPRRSAMKFKDCGGYSSV